MSRLIIILAVGILGYLFWLEYKKRNPQQKQEFLLNSGFWALFCIVLLLVATGRVHWIAAAVTAALPLLKGVLGLALRNLPILLPWLRKKHQQTRDTQPPPSSGNMTEEEAWQLLGLAPGASREEIIHAHKKLMQKL